MNERECRADAGSLTRISRGRRETEGAWTSSDASLTEVGWTRDHMTRRSIQRHERQAYCDLLLTSTLHNHRPTGATVALFALTVSLGGRLHHVQRRSYAMLTHPEQIRYGHHARVTAMGSIGASSWWTS